MMATQFVEPDAFARKYREIFGDGQAEEIEDLRRRMMDGLRDGTIAFPDMKEVGLQYGFRSAGDTAQAIFQMPWVLLHAGDGSS